MKSQIFKTAWQLVKSTGMDLSNALKVSWAQWLKFIMKVVAMISN